MKLKTGLIFAILAVLSSAQVPTRTAGERLPSERRFPPEVWPVRAGAAFEKPARSYCVYPSLETRTIGFRRCAAKNTIRLLPPAKPATDLRAR